MGDLEQLEQLGYQPQEQASGEVILRNCVFADLSASHRDLVCGMNAALIRGMLAGAQLKSSRIEQRAEPAPLCCVRVAPG